MTNTARRMERMALKYAALDLPVLACESRGKKPITEHGLKDATTNPDTIREQWRKKPDANIGIPMGPQSGMFALDVDGPEGTASLAKLIEKHGPLPTTLEQRTGKGIHFVFRYPRNGATIRNSASKIGPGLDVRGDGGYIIVAPSVHSNGTIYEWLAGQRPSQIEPADAPPWLLDLVVDKPPPTPSERPEWKGNGSGARYAEAALEREAEAVAKAPEGQRNDKLNNAAFSLGQLVGSGALLAERVEAELTRAALHAGLDPIETANTIKSGMSSGAAEPREVPERGPGRRFDRARTPTDDQAQEGTVEAKPGVRPATNPAQPRPHLILSQGDPLTSAEKFLAEHYTIDGRQFLYHLAGVFYAWNGTSYLEVDDAAIRAEVYAFLKEAVCWNDQKLVPFKPTSRKVSDVMDALRAISNLPATIAAPCWLAKSSGSQPPSSEILSCQNGLLHLPTLVLRPATPTFFSRNALNFEFDMDAPPPTHWLRFLEVIWSHDPDAIETLQQIFGYLLTLDTSQQKIFLIVGPMRSGKGTIGRVLTHLLGRANVCGPTLAGLSQNFGLAPLIDKHLAIIADARLSSRTDQAVITERLLSISGEDALTIDRKYRPAWTGTLPTRFLLLTNELPRLADASGALTSRLIVLMLKKSFLGKEDLGLINRLVTELPGILNWAIDGYHRLSECGHFVQPASSAEAIQRLEDLGSPVGAFLRDCCKVGPEHTVEKTILFERWKQWCEAQGRTRPGTVATFGRDLYAIVPELRTSRSQSANDRLNSKRVWKYVGIGLLD